MEKYRYVEVCDTASTRFRAVIPSDPVGSHEAEAIAIEEAAQAWGIPESEVEVFVARTVTKEKHQKLVEAALKGTLNPDWWLADRSNKVELPSSDQ